MINVAVLEQEIVIDGLAVFAVVVHQADTVNTVFSSVIANAKNSSSLFDQVAVSAAVRSESNN